MPTLRAADAGRHYGPAKRVADLLVRVSAVANALERLHQVLH